MKKFLILLILSSLLFSCSNDNDDEKGKGYRTSLENVKKGIIGVWKTTTGGVYYYGYDVTGKSCAGFTPEELTDGCNKYEIFKRDDSYIIRGYGIGDLEGIGSYLEAEITFLDEKKLTIGSNTYTRVK